MGRGCPAGLEDEGGAAGPGGARALSPPQLQKEPALSTPDLAQGGLLTPGTPRAAAGTAHRAYHSHLWSPLQRHEAQGSDAELRWPATPDSCSGSAIPRGLLPSASRRLSPLAPTLDKVSPGTPQLGANTLDSGLQEKTLLSQQHRVGPVSLTVWAPQTASSLSHAYQSQGRAPAPSRHSTLPSSPRPSASLCC